MTVFDLVLIGLAAVAGGTVNALAGGGTLITVPMLTASFSINIEAAVFFIFSGQVMWLAALVTAVGALTGGAAGGRLAGRINPITLRRIVIFVGLAVAVIYFVR